MKVKKIYVLLVRSNKYKRITIIQNKKNTDIQNTRKQDIKFTIIHKECIKVDKNKVNKKWVIKYYVFL